MKNNDKILGYDDDDLLLKPQKSNNNNLQKSFPNTSSKGLLKPEHVNFPIAIGELNKKYYKTGSKAIKEDNYELAFNIYLETFSQNFNEAYEFVVCIANAKSRQEFIQSFEVNAASLYSSVTLGFTADQICQKLLQFSKIDYLSPEIRQFIHSTTSSYGKCRLVLMNNKYFIESEDLEVLRYYHDLPNLADCWNSQIYKIDLTDQFESDFSTKPTTNYSEMVPKLTERVIVKESNEFLMKLIDEKGNEDLQNQNFVKPVFRLEIDHQKIDKVRIDRVGISKYKYMMSQEFDYLNVDEKVRLPFNLRPTAKFFNKNPRLSRTRDFENVYW